MPTRLTIELPVELNYQAKARLTLKGVTENAFATMGTTDSLNNNSSSSELRRPAQPLPYLAEWLV